jgi:hypothetical protein
MAGVTATIDLSIKAKQTGAAHRGAAPSIVQDASKSFEFSAGTAATSQANVLYSETRTLAASAAEDLDLAGVLADALGATITAAEIVAIYIAAASGNTNDVQVTRPAANGVPAVPRGRRWLRAWSGRFRIAADEQEGRWQSWPRTADLAAYRSTAAQARASTYDIVVIGRTVAAYNRRKQMPYDIEDHRKRALS